ncbi:MAG: nucleoside hydrolase [Clostridium sp.]|jgi:inosine/uridine-preferring nucleoside hydrolase|nr:nucleoside hydrolase [Clostridium sp.]
MKIGIDIDNVISNFNDELLKEYLKHDKELRNTGIINKDVFIRYGMFDWTEKEETEFYKNSIERIAIKLKPIHRATETIKKLKEDGNEIIIISGRNNGEYNNPYKLTEEWLAKYNIVYDKLILTNAYNKEEKANVCKENNIDIMIEDSTQTAVNIEKVGTKVLFMNTRYNKNNENFEKVSNWKEIYSKISKLYKKDKNIDKINVILDTDTYNECDDQFALAYLLKSQERFNIEAITVAPYHHDNNISIIEGNEKSYNEIIKICKYLNFDTTNKVYKGSEDYLQNNYNETTKAVEKIIEIALKNEKTYILSIGAITNIAIAILKEPKIIDRIEIIWLGGNSLLQNKNDEFNFRQDIKAVKTIFESNAKLTIIPCKNVASNLITSIYELEHFLKGKNELCDYLCQRFYNDGVHGIQERRVIWDISVIAYMLNKSWFMSEEISCPRIREDSSYELTNNNHKITMINYIDVNKVYTDLFNKLTK